MKDGICSSVLSKQDIRLVATLKTPPKLHSQQHFTRTIFTTIELVHIEIKMGVNPYFRFLGVLNKKLELQKKEKERENNEQTFIKCSSLPD